MKKITNKQLQEQLNKLRDQLQGKSNYLKLDTQFKSNLNPLFLIYWLRKLSGLLPIIKYIKNLSKFSWWFKILKYIYRFCIFINALIGVMVVFQHSDISGPFIGIYYTLINLGNSYIDLLLQLKVKLIDIISKLFNKILFGDNTNITEVVNKDLKFNKYSTDKHNFVFDSKGEISIEDKYTKYYWIGGIIIAVVAIGGIYYYWDNIYDFIKDFRKGKDMGRPDSGTSQTINTNDNNNN